MASCRRGAGHSLWGSALQTCADVAILPLRAFQRQREREGELGREKERCRLAESSLSFLLTLKTTFRSFHINTLFPFDTLDTRKHLRVNININMVVHSPLHPASFHPHSDLPVITNSNSGIRLNLDDFPEGISAQINFLEL